MNGEFMGSDGRIRYRTSTGRLCIKRTKEQDSIKDEKYRAKYREKLKAKRELRRAKNRAAYLQQRKDSHRRNRAVELKKSKSYHLFRLYGITLEDFYRISESQQGRCACCGVRDKKLVVDHCHKTGKVRALLCQNCNCAAGHLHDDPRRAVLLSRYLKAHQELLRLLPPNPNQMGLFAAGPAMKQAVML